MTTADSTIATEEQGPGLSPDGTRQAADTSSGPKAEKQRFRFLRTWLRITFGRVPLGMYPDLPENHKGPVAVLIHGTMAPEAAWAEPTAKLATALSSLEVAPVRFGWTSLNSHKARWEAGEHLRRDLITLRRQTSVSDIHLIGHSHGGNVALYALSHGDPELENVRVTTMATPFISAMKPKRPLLVPIAALIFGLAAVFAYIAATDEGEPSRVATVIVFGLVIPSGVAALGILLGSLTRWRSTAVPFEKLIARTPGSTDVLTVSCIGDEAAAALAAASMAPRLPNLVWKRLVPLVALVTVGGLLVGEIWPSIGGAAVIAAFALIFAVFIALFLGIAAGQLAVAGLSMFRYSDVLFTSDTSPTGVSRAQRLEPSESEMVHDIYNRSSAIDAVVANVVAARAQVT